MIWFGGSAVTYNFDGIAYNGSGGVSPIERILEYDPLNGDLISDGENSFPDFMDYRGIASFPDDNTFYFCGGMESGQSVSNKTFALVNPTSSTREKETDFGINIFPNPSSDFVKIEIEGQANLHISNIEGRLFLKDKIENSSSINLKSYRPGIYIFSLFKDGKLVHSERVVRE